MSHITSVRAAGPLWIATCTCGWESLADRNVGRVNSHARQHRAIILDGNAKAAEASEAYQRERLSRSNPAWESLAQADRHITHCHTCGTQVWDGDCGTCNTLAMRLARKVVNARDYAEVVK